MTTFTCPVDGDFDAEPEVRVTQSGYDVAVVDANGQHPSMADHVDALGVPLLAAQRMLLAGIENPSWRATYEHVTLGRDGKPGEDPVEDQVVVCPTCGSPIKVG